MATGVSGGPPGSAFIAGKAGYVQVLDEDTQATTSYPMGEWQVPLKAEFIRRNNFNSLGYQDGVSGFKAAELTVRGPYAIGATPIVVGGFYWFYLGITADGPVEFAVYAHVSQIVPVNKSEGAPDIEVRCDSVGQFTIATQ